MNRAPPSDAAAGAIRIVPITAAYAQVFREVVGEVARERRYLRATDAFSIDQAMTFVGDNVIRSNPHFVALDRDRVVGWCDIVRLPFEGENHRGTLGIGLLAPYRGRGVGRRLMDAALTHARAKGFERVELAVRASNLRAIGLYRALGFVEEGRRRDAIKLDGTFDDEVLMAWFARPANKRPVTKRAADESQQGPGSNGADNGVQKWQ